MYSLTFRVRVTTPPQYGRNGARIRRVDFIGGEGSLRRTPQVCVRRAVGLTDYRWALPRISIVLP